MTNGTHKGGWITKTIETAALETKHLLVSPGTSQDKIVACPTSAGIPIGVCTDEGAVGDKVNVKLLGSADETVLMVAEAEVTTNVFVVPGGTTAGTVRALPETPGTYYVVGRVVKGGAAGTLIEVDPIPCAKVTIAAAAAAPLAWDALVDLTAAADHSGLEGYFVEVVSDEASVCDAATDIPYGVIVTGAEADAEDRLALSGSGLIAPVMLTTTPGTVGPGTFLVLHTDGTTLADPGTGARVRVARAVAAGTGDAVVQAVLIDPVALS